MRRQISFFILFLYAYYAFSMGSRVSIESAIDNVIKKYGIEAEKNLQKQFAHANVTYPPKKIALLTFKKEKYVELWAKDNHHQWSMITKYPLTASSGMLGPKLKENDKQIPEGIYRLTTFNPFSQWHLSLMVDYPNAFDKLYAKEDRRKKLGGDIFIHGKATSVGCLAVGDKAIEQLFVLARRVGLQNTKLIIAPNDLRAHKPLTNLAQQPRWVPKLYADIKQALQPFHLKSHV